MMQVPLVDLGAQHAALQAELRAALDRVCAGQEFILGPEVAALEAEIAAATGARAAIGVSSGTDALLVTLMALGVGPGDEVITSPFTFFATAGVIHRLGARPVFADIEPDSFNLDPAQASARITPRTRAIIPVHLFGRCADLAPLLSVAGARRTAVIEDAAQAIGATSAAGASAGSSGLAGCYSFFPAKNLGACGDGGMVVTSDLVLADTVRLLRVHGSQPKYYHRLVGGNFRLDELQAAVLRVKLPHLAAWTRARQRHAARYRDLFAAAGFTDRLTLPAAAPGHAYNQFVIRAPERDALQAFLAARGVGTAVYYPLPLHLQECFRHLGYRPGDFPAAEEAARTALALPIYPELTVTQQAYVVAQVQEFFAQSAGRVAPGVSP